MMISGAAIPGDARNPASLGIAADGTIIGGRIHLTIDGTI